jgi:8-oxo-dGTP pyrophosphatase MutT (NUDIX family)
LCGRFGGSGWEPRCREVREETGWTIHEHQLVRLGFLHFEHLVPPPPDYPYPAPDFIQLVYGARVRAEAGPARPWTDSEGWESRSYLVPPDRINEPSIQPNQWPFISALFDGAP